MKRIQHYFVLHKTEIIYDIIVCIGLVLAIVTQSGLPIIFICLLYIMSVAIDFVIFESSPTPIQIKTPDGYNEPYHPSVLYFANGWNGYRYWMAFTPMPKKAAHSPYTDRWECPCVYASNDGISFDVPVGGVREFIDDLTKKEICNRDYFSDTHLVYNEETDSLELYYRLTNRNENAPNGEVLRLLRKISKDGVNWTEREKLVNSDENPNIGLVYISPAIIWQNQGYMMWFVSSYQDNRSLSCAKSKNMKSFYDISKCTLVGRSCDPWHIDCHKVGNHYYLLIYEFSNELTIWKSNDGIEFQFQRVLLRSSARPGLFYHALYRACITENYLGGYSMYFSAQNQKEMGLGIAIGNEIDNFKIVNGNGKKQSRLFIDDIINKYFYLVGKMLRECKEKLHA